MLLYLYQELDCIMLIFSKVCLCPFFFVAYFDGNLK